MGADERCDTSTSSSRAGCSTGDGGTNALLSERRLYVATHDDGAAGREVGGWVARWSPPMVVDPSARARLSVEEVSSGRPGADKVADKMDRPRRAPNPRKRPHTQRDQNTLAAGPDRRGNPRAANTTATSSSSPKAVATRRTAFKWKIVLVAATRATRRCTSTATTRRRSTIVPGQRRLHRPETVDLHRRLPGTSTMRWLTYAAHGPNKGSCSSTLRGPCRCQRRAPVISMRTRHRAVQTGRGVRRDPGERGLAVPYRGDGSRARRGSTPTASAAAAQMAPRAPSPKGLSLRGTGLRCGLGMTSTTHQFRTRPARKSVLRGCRGEPEDLDVRPVRTGRGRMPRGMHAASDASGFTRMAADTTRMQHPPGRSSP